MVKVNNDLHEVATVVLYSPSGEYLGFIKNLLALLDVRLQIKTQKLSGYSILWCRHDSLTPKRINIDSNGKLDHNPEGLFDEAETYMWKLL